MHLITNPGATCDISSAQTLLGRISKATQQHLEAGGFSGKTCFQQILSSMRQPTALFVFSSYIAARKFRKGRILFHEYVTSRSDEIRQPKTDQAYNNNFQRTQDHIGDCADMADNLHWAPLGDSFLLPTSCTVSLSASDK